MIGYAIQQSQTAQPLTFLMVLTSDHITGATGLSPTVTISKNGAAFGSPSGAVTEIANGWYKVAGNATDSGTLGPLLLHATAGTADDVDVSFNVVAYDPQAVTNMGLTALPAAVADAAGGLPISDAGGLDLDAKLANTNEITVARMGALTDWVDGGRLDLLLDDVPTVSEFNARTLAAASYFDPAADTVATVTTLTNLPAITSNWLTAAGIAASALDGKGDWNTVVPDAAGTASTHSALDVWHVAAASVVTASTIGLQLKTNVDAVLTDRTLAAASYFDPAADTVATVTTVTGAVGSVTGAVGSVAGNVDGSVASVTGAVGSVTGAVGSVTGHTVQTGDSYAIVNGASGLVAIDGKVDTAQADLDLLTGADGALLATTQTTGWPANLAASAGQIIKATVDTVTNTHTPTTTEFQADDITEATADHYNGRIVIFTSGGLAGQATDITDYSAVGGIGQFTVTALTEAPSNNDTFVIV